MVRGRLTVQLERTGEYSGIVHATRQIVGKVGSLSCPCCCRCRSHRCCCCQALLR